MSHRHAARALLDRLLGHGYQVCEVLVKEGRTRRSEIGPQGPASVMTVEEGWAIRAGGTEGGCFACGSGHPPRDADWPALGGGPLRLPEPGDRAEPEDSADETTPLVVEGEARGMLDGIRRELAAALPGSRLIRAVLDDGSSSSHLINSRGVEADSRHRLASLVLEAAWKGTPQVRTSVQVMARGAQRLEPRALVKRLVDSLTTRRGDAAPERDRGDMVLAPAVGAALVDGLSALWIGAEAEARARSLIDRHDRLASTLLTVVDDGRLPEGIVASAYDGEGSPTRRLTIVDAGRYVQPLVDWREAAPPRWRPAGCIRRPGWRDAPRLAASHLFVEPAPDVPAHDLVASVARGFYLLEPLGPVRVDLEGDRFAVPVCGFSLRQGRAEGAIAEGWLCGGIGALLRGVRGVGRDLGFFPLGALAGAPSMLVGGLELRRSL